MVYFQLDTLLPRMVHFRLDGPPPLAELAFVTFLCRKVETVSVIVHQSTKRALDLTYVWISHILQGDGCLSTQSSHISTRTARQKLSIGQDWSVHICQQGS